MTMFSRITPVFLKISLIFQKKILDKEEDLMQRDEAQDRDVYLRRKIIPRSSKTVQQIWRSQILR